ncbi:glycosaminoglycan xylosylkinase homolog [Amyelois transitella]|uniref:glycosaminoglycan xylosylkinase homolog n=1 Tax=Amyelois transitella TaxID=680683 RepID=UPI0029901677|nr:glycosaminoglycan xylosylkinase homolog [Amyelois transitella]
MSMNYAFGFSIILLILVVLNIYFFYTLNTVGKKGSSYKVPSEVDLTTNIYREINDYLNYLPSQYKNRNPKYTPIQRSLVQSFNSTKLNIIKDVWQYSKNWESEESLFPQESGILGKLLQKMRKATIYLVDVAPKGSQMKLSLLLEGKNKVLFKPKRYELNHVIAAGDIYGGFDRHNSEVFAYYLAMVMNFKWIAPSVLRKINVKNDVFPVATRSLKLTMVKNGTTRCIFGKCLYCHVKHTVCPDKNGDIEGAAILFLEKKFQTHASPWRRSYNSRKMSWELEHNYCMKLTKNLTLKRILNLVDVSLFDFLIQNGDRHHYEVYKDKIILLDNGKGLGNPTADAMDILAPLYQCCMISNSTWRHLELLSGGILTETIKILSSFEGYKLATDDHYKAVERRLLKIYATIQYCIGKHGSSKVFKIS